MKSWPENLPSKRRVLLASALLDPRVNVGGGGFGGAADEVGSFELVEEAVQCDPYGLKFGEPE